MRPCRWLKSPSARTSARNISSSFSASCARLVWSIAPGVPAAATGCREASEIPVSGIIAAVDEPLRVTRCEGDAVEGCVKGERCCAHDLWSSLGRQMMYFLDSITLDDVVSKRNLALAAAVKQAKDHYVRPGA